MAVDTPARIAILGAGPIGLETALYARFLGYEVDIIEQGRIGASVHDWSDVRMFSPFHMNCSSLGLAAIEAQDPEYQAPAKDALLTGGEWLTRYLLPLAQTDLLNDHIQQQTTVVHVGRSQLRKRDLPADDSRHSADFRILLQDADGTERIGTSDVVIDTTGVYSQANWLGVGGIPAVGERQLRDQIHYRLPAILGDQRDRFAERTTLLIGSGYTAATNAVALNNLISETTDTQVIWLTRKPAGTDPIRSIPDDRLPERAALTAQANALAHGSDERFRYLGETGVLSIEQREGRYHVEIAGDPGETLVVDEVIANVGFRPDLSLFQELQVHQCYASEGPMKLAATLLAQDSADCLDQAATGPDSLLNPEPNFYLLGSKSYGRNSNFLFAHGLQQVRDLFTVIGDRAGLDLYAGMKHLG